MSDLLDWYDRRRRDLPWRDTRDPYRVWVSEVMLQQTRVQTVIPYYERFLRRFPDVGTLAAAPVEEVLAAWSGLGYYRRARQLHRAAVTIAAAGAGFPSTAAALAQLPGIGPYTAAAVASIAFGEVIAVLDGNVERLLCRWLGCDEDPKRAATRRKLTAAAESLLDRSRPGDANQALMELGATVCRPSRPACDECPLAPGCQGARHGDPERYPVRRRRRATERREISVAVARRADRVLLFRRADGSDLLAGMWELPNVSRSPDPGEVEAALARRYGGRWKLSEAAAVLRHAITYRAIAAHVHEAVIEAGDSIAEGPEAVWADAERRERLPTSSLVEKVLAELRPRDRSTTRRRRR
jgi:A/G-specific adenine glycosylase